MMQSAPAAPAAAPLMGQDILCFSHDWTGDPLSKTHIMRILARNNRVLWINSIGYRAPAASGADLKRAARKLAAALKPIEEVEPNLYVLNPLALPLYRLPWARQLNRRLLTFLVRRAMRQLGFGRPINFVFNPAAALIAGQFDEQRLIYYCVDEYTAFSGVAGESLAEMERGLLRQADLVIVSAERLYQAKALYNARTHLIRHGVDFEHFRRALDPQLAVPAAIARLPRPIIGYFGLLAPDWVDAELLERVARHYAHGSLVLLGKSTMELSSLTALPNVHWLGRQPYADLPAFCKGFDVGLIPFPINEATLHSNPLKCREYLAAGLPVASTAIPEVETLGLCHVGRGTDGYLAAIDAALREPGPRAERSEQMRTESWKARVAELNRLLAEVPRRTAQAGSVHARPGYVSQALE